MKIIVVLLFNLLLLNGYLTANISNKSTHSDERHQNLRQNSTKASELNENFEYTIFESFNLMDMLKFVKSSRNAEFVRKYISPTKYHNYDFSIRPDDANAAGGTDEHGTWISLFGHSFYMEILEYFGNSINRLHIGNVQRINDNRSAEIHQQVNEYCSESLNFLSLTWIRGIMLDQFKKPFTNLETFDIFLNNDEIGSFESLDIMFPKLRRLEIAYKAPEPNPISGGRFIESDVPHMPHLKELSIFNEPHDHSDIPIIENQLQQIMEKNPQINRVMYSANKRGSFIKVIEKYLPNIEYLDIMNIDFDIEPVRFDHVKRWYWSSSIEEPIEKLLFPNLESLRMYFAMEQNHKTINMKNAWISFMKNHQTIRQLNITVHGKGFANLTLNLPNIREMNIQSFSNFEADEVIEIIEGHENLVNLWYQSSPLFQPNQTELATFNEKFGNQWNITFVTRGWGILKFVKKN